MKTDTQTETEPAIWDDTVFLHAYRHTNRVWDGGPAACGYKGPGPKGLGKFIPANACPICVALFKYLNN